MQNILSRAAGDYAYYLTVKDNNDTIHTFLGYEELEEWVIESGVDVDDLCELSIYPLTTIQ